MSKLLLDDVSFEDLLAPSLADDPNVRAMARALDQEFRDINAVINSIILLPKLEEITDHKLIDLLAWQMHVDFYESTFSLELKRKIIRKSIQWHAHKGTKWVVEQILHTVFETGEVLEWFEYHPKPHDDWHDAYRFRVIVPSAFAKPDQARRLFMAINAVKPVSRWLDGFIMPKRPITTQLYLGIARIHWISTIINLGPTKATGNIFAGLALAHYMMTTIDAPA